MTSSPSRTDTGGRLHISQSVPTAASVPCFNNVCFMRVPDGNQSNICTWKNSSSDIYLRCLFSICLSSILLFLTPSRSWGFALATLRTRTPWPSPTGWPWPALRSTMPGLDRWRIRSSHSPASCCRCRWTTQRAASSAPSVSSLEVLKLGTPEDGREVTSLWNAELEMFVSSRVRLNRPSGPGGAVEGGGAAGAAAGGAEDLLPQTATQHAPHVPQGPHEDHWPAQHQRQRSENSWNLKKTSRRWSDVTFWWVAFIIIL